MKRTIMVAALTCATAVVMSGAALAAAPIDGTGTVGTCPLTGQIKIKPALVNGGTAAGGTKAKGKSSGACTGGTMDGATVASFKAKGTSTTTSNDCISLLGPASTNLQFVIKWKVTPGSPKLNPSTVTFTTQTGGIAMDTTHASFDLVGTVTAGSFMGNPVTVHAETDQALTDLGAACGAKGIKKITFGANSLSNASF